MYLINSTADNKMSFSLHICFLSFVRKYSTPCSYQNLLNYIIIILLYYFSSTETQVRVVFDYTAQEADELSIKVGEILEVFSNEVEEGWCKGCNECAYLCMYIGAS